MSEKTIQLSSLKETRASLGMLAGINNRISRVASWMGAFAGIGLPFLVFETHAPISPELHRQAIIMTAAGGVSLMISTVAIIRAQRLEEHVSNLSSSRISDRHLNI